MTDGPRKGSAARGRRVGTPARVGAAEVSAAIDEPVPRSAHDAMQALTAMFTAPSLSRRAHFKYPVDEPSEVWLALEAMIPTEPAVEFAEWVQMLRREGLIR